MTSFQTTSFEATSLKTTPLKTTSLLVIFAVVVVTQCDETVTGRYTAGFGDQVLAGCQVFAVEVRSLLDCAVTCRRHPSCLTFTLHQQVCTGHSSKFHSGSPPTVPTPGARTFLDSDRDWLNLPCSQNDTCCEPSAICWENQCKCTPATFYSLSTKNCVSYCNSSMATVPFQEYILSSLYLSAMSIIPNMSLADCLQGCQHIPRCMSVVFRHTDSRCSHMDKTAQDGNFKPHWTSYHYYQKSCA